MPALHIIASQMRPDGDPVNPATTAVSAFSVAKRRSFEAF